MFLHFSFSLWLMANSDPQSLFWCRGKSCFMVLTLSRAALMTGQPRQWPGSGLFGQQSYIGSHIKRYSRFRLKYPHQCLSAGCSRVVRVNDVWKGSALLSRLGCSWLEHMVPIKDRHGWANWSCKILTAPLIAPSSCSRQAALVSLTTKM